MSLPELFLQYIKEQNLFQPQHRLLLAVSGGADSVVMAQLCFQTGFSFAIAHCNFGLRGEESKRDEDFVRELALKYKTEFFVQQFDTLAYAGKNKLSVQEAARNLRYQWFDELMHTSEPGFYRLLTAHHADDNVETVLMHLFKGTGIHGLTGIPARNGNVVRPLLFALRSEIEHFAREHQLNFVEDSSNAQEKYDRNFLRNRVLPLIREHHPQVSENIAASITRFKETELIYREAVEQKRSKLVEERGGEWHIPVRKLLKQVPLHTMVYELIKPFGFSSAQTTEVVRLLDAGTGKQITSHTHRILKNRDWIIISTISNPVASIFVIKDAGEHTETEAGIYSTKTVRVEPGMALPEHPFSALIDAAKIRFPLILRKWKTGDYFYPLGMKKKKKLSRFFIDLKLSKTDKEKVWVLESDKKILWVVGYRIDDRVKITASSVNGLLCLFRPATI